MSNLANADDQTKLDDFVPIDYIMEWIRERMHVDKMTLKNRILVLRSDTGSGKSTAFPATILEKFFKPGRGDIACTQPRIINAVSIVRDLTASGFYPALKLGKNIGWLTGSTQREVESGLIYMTIGTLVMQLKSMTDDQIMQKYKFIIVDEVHESSLEQAMLLFVLKNFMIRNQHNVNLPFVVLTSATFDTNKFLKYFEVFDPAGQPNLIQVSGFTYPLTTNWTLTRPSTNFIVDIAELAIKTHLNNLDDEPTNADILIFLPGLAEITSVQKILLERVEKLAKEKSPIYMTLAIMRETINQSGPDYLAVFAPHHSLKVTAGNREHQPVRRIILSTNVAETGVTIDTLKYVIDSGFTRTPEYDPNFGTNALITKAATKTMIRQRMGRANRKSPGVFLPLYPEAIYKQLDNVQLGSIETSDISGILLLIMAEQARKNHNLIKETNQQFNTKDLDMLDMPSGDSMASALETLYLLGFISPNSDYKHIELTANTLYTMPELIKDTFAETPQYNLTKLGALASQFNKLSPQQIRMILAGYAWGVSELDLVTIAAWLSLNSKDSKTDPSTEINWVSIYREGLPVHFSGGITVTSGESIVYKTKLTIADDFINGLILFYAIENTIRSAESREAIFDTLRAWCLSRQIQYQFVIDFIKMREFIIDNMIMMGLNVFDEDELRNIPEESFIDTITKIKYCIYEGYRNNIAVFDDSAYRTQQGLKLKIPAMFSKNEIKMAEEQKYGISISAKPKYILYDSVMLRSERNAKVFTASAGRICVLDGFVKNDLKF